MSKLEVCAKYIHSKLTGKFFGFRAQILLANFDLIVFMLFILKVWFYKRILPAILYIDLYKIKGCLLIDFNFICNRLKRTKIEFVFWFFVSRSLIKDQNRP